jgi:hypothetical protein
MNQKKKSRRAQGLGLDSGLDLAISRFTNSLVFVFNGRRDLYCDGRSVPPAPAGAAQLQASTFPAADILANGSTILSGHYQYNRSLPSP